MTKLVPAGEQVVVEIRALIDAARRRAAAAVNAELTLLYWRIGQRIRVEVLNGVRATYGEEVIKTLAEGLTQSYGRGWGAQQLRYCLRVAEAFPDEQIVNALRLQLSWTHLRALAYVDDPLKREFYAEMCRIEGWSARRLQERMGAQLFERTAISRKPEETMRLELAQLRQTQDLTPAMVLKDPYLLDFLGLSDHYLERDLEDAILRDIEQFLLEMGAGFTFVARQKRIQVDEDDFYIDLLLYNRRLRRLVAIELKLDKFRPEHKGQMELYLRWLARHEQEPGEQPPIGIILCTGRKKGQIELLELDQAGIHVAEYLTVLPAPDALEARLQQAIDDARKRHGGDGA
ncbi:MAG: PDDEXK nuclease domain-containing protein [Pseudomonadota bacterium]|nr:PDDEXK nuclease domain-containing protein [Pseudomonadota bacterium]